MRAYRYGRGQTVPGAKLTFDATGGSSMSDHPLTVPGSRCEHRSHPIRITTHRYP